MESNLDTPKDAVDKPHISSLNNKLLIKHFFHKFKFPLSIALLLVVLLFLLFYAINKNSSSQKKVLKNQVTITTNPTANWQTYSYGFLRFSIKYPADLLTPGFSDIDPSTRVNRYEVAVDPKAVIYGNEAYKSAEFSMGSGLNVGILGTGLASSWNKIGFGGIEFHIQYFDKDISWLKDYYAKYLTPVTFTEINGIKVAIVDVPSNVLSRKYYFKMGSDLLDMGAAMDKLASVSDKAFMYRLLDEVAKSLSENVDVSNLPTPTSDSCTKDFSGHNTSIDATVTDLPDTSNWSTYALPNEKLSFRYPSDWKIEEITYQPGHNGFSYLTESVGLTSSNGFKIGISTGGQGFGGGCGYDCQCENLDNYVLGTLNFKSNPEYIVVHGLKENSIYGNANIRFGVIPYKYCWDNLCYPGGAKNTQGALSISGTWNNSKFMQPNDFISSPDVKTAVSILKTLHY
jgi:hypothetical protein